MTTTERHMATMNAIIDYWREHEERWLKSWYIGWGEPFCFACGWLPPVPDGRRDSWRVAGHWLDRAHLHDHAGGGSGEADGLMPVCHLCHADMPMLDSREQGLEWVKKRAQCDPEWQLWTDAKLWGKTPTRSTTLIRSRMKFLETRAKAQKLGGTVTDWLLVEYRVKEDARAATVLAELGEQPTLDTERADILARLDSLPIVRGYDAREEFQASIDRQVAEVDALMAAGLTHRPREEWVKQERERRRGQAYCERELERLRAGGAP